MFEKECDKGSLRQGDIVQAVLFPRIDYNDLTILTSPDLKNVSVLSDINSYQFKVKNLTNNKCLSGQISFSLEWAIVTSQCCDLALRNDNLPKTKNILLAKLINVKSVARTEDELKKLKENTPREYYRNFFIAQTDPLPDNLVVDFTLIFPLPQKNFELILCRKVLQMTDEYRCKFKFKLGSFFSRATQEEIDAGFL